MPWLGFSILDIVLRKLPVSKAQTIVMCKVVIKLSSQLSLLHILPGQYFIDSLVYMKVDIVLIGKIDRKTLDSWWLSMYIELKDLLVSFSWTNKPTIQVYFDLILHPTTNLYSCSVRTLIDVLAEILDSSQSSRNLYINITIKKKKKLRTVRDHILISKPGPIALKYQAIVLWEPQTGKGFPYIWTLNPKPQSIQ